MSDEMMTLDDLQHATINPEVAREALTQAQRRLEDALATKVSHEQKAFALLAAFTTVALALFTVFGMLTAGPNHDIAPAFLLVGAMYAIGAIVAGVALLPVTYGALGSDPSAWLRPGVIDGGSAALAASLAYEAFFHRARIDASLKANAAKARLIRGAIAIGVIAPVVLGAWIARTKMGR